MSKYYFGIDAGNSKTQCLIADETGRVHALVRLGSGNWEGIGLEATQAVYQQGLDMALAEAGIEKSQIAAAGYGLAGYDFDSDEARLRPVVASLGLAGPYFIENDSLIIFRAGATRPYGVACISGSGSTKAGRSKSGRVFRTWGMSPEMGDWGGGGDICRRALAAVAKSEKGIAPPTALAGLLTKHYGATSVSDLIEMVSARGQIYRIDYTHLVFEAAEAADPVANQILLDAGRLLAKSTNAVIRELDLEKEVFELVLGGSVFKADYPLMRNALSVYVRQCAPHMEIVRLTAPPVVGAVLAAMDEDRIVPDEAVRARLIEEVQARE